MAILDNLYFTFMNFVVLLGVNINPIGIATNAEPGGVTAVVENEDSFFTLFDFGSLFQLLKRDGLLIATIIIVFLLICMFWINKAEKLADKKADIMHKLVIVFLICSVLWILEVIISALDFIF